MFPLRSMPRARRGLRGILAGGLLLGALAGCVTNPVTGRREISLMSPAQERALGEQAASQVAQEIGLVEDPALVAYVDALGQRMARLSPRQDVTYQFAVADMPEPNAFALPGGWIYVSRGLLAISNSEDELANVIGHEIGHVAARHSAQRQTRSIGVGLLSALGTILAGQAGGSEAARAVAEFGQIAGAGLIASYGRDQERQSDEIGQKLAAGSGWDPTAMAHFLGTLGRESRLRSGKERLPSFLDSHPMTEERVRNTAARAGDLPVTPTPPVASSRADFLSRLDGLLVGTDPAEGVFQESRFLHPALDFRIDFPSGWRTANQKTLVGAQSPEADASVVLQAQGEAGDPRQAAQRFAEQNKLQLQDLQSGRIGGYPAVRARAQARGQQGDLGLDLTWIAHPRLMLRLTGASPLARFGAYEREFAEVAASLRGLSSPERDSIRERRLRVVQARRGESLAALARRTGNVWSLEETAVANGLIAEGPLRSGQPVKIAVERPYTP